MRRHLWTLSIGLSSSLLWLLVTTWHAYTCGPWPDYEKARISYVDPDILSDSIYQGYYRLLLQQHQSTENGPLDEEHYWYSPNRMAGNIDLWVAYFDGRIPSRSLHDLITVADSGVVKKAIAMHDAGRLASMGDTVTPATDAWSSPDTLLIGAALAEIDRRDDRPFLDYLLYAKRSAAHAWQIDPDAWDDERKSKDLVRMRSLIDEGRKRYASVASPDLKRRYGYQLVRLARYAGLYDDASRYFRDYVEKDPRRDALYFMALGHHAGARRYGGDIPHSNALFARLFDSSAAQRGSALRDIRLSGPDALDRMLAHATNDHERVNHLLIGGLKANRLTFAYLDDIYRVDPSSPKLPLALMRELHRVESYLYDERETRDLTIRKRGTVTEYEYIGDGEYDSSQTNVLPPENPARDRHLSAGGWDTLYYFRVDPDDRYNRDRRRLDTILSGEEYVDAFRTFVLRVARERRVPEPALWYMVAGYLDIMLGDYRMAEECLDDAAATAGGNYDLKHQIRLLTYLRQTHQNGRPDSSPADVAETLRWMAAKQASNGHSKFDRTMAEIGRRALVGEDVLRAVLAFDRADDIVTRNLLLDIYANDEELEELGEMVAEGADNPLDKIFLDSFSLSADAITDVRATRMMRQGKYREARDLYRTIPHAYWREGSPAAESICFRFWTNRVVVDTNMPDGIRQGDGSTDLTVTRGEFAEELVASLEKLERSRGGATVEALVEAGDLLYNTPFWGYNSTVWDGNLNWMYSFYFYGPSAYPFNLPKVAERMEEAHAQFMDSWGTRNAAREFYRRATTIAGNPELSARAAYMLDLCDKQPTASIHRDRPSIAEQPREGYEMLTTKFAGTETGKTILSRCSVYRLNSW